MRKLAPILAALFVAGSLCAATPEECWQQRHHGRMAAAHTCFESLTRSANPAVRAEGYWGIEDFVSANDQFRLAEEANPNDANLKVRWGRMYLDHPPAPDTASLFQDALQLDPHNAGALLGLALLASEDFEAKAVELAQRALAEDPKLVEAQELLAYLALEDVDEEKATAEADKALAMSGEALEAMAIRATIDWLHDKPDTEWIHRILAINPVYGEAYAVAGHFFVINRRYEEGIEYYRKALELNPRLWRARSELGVNLMRVGEEAEARRNLEECYDNGYQSDATVNTLRLLDRYKDFVAYTTDQTVVRLHKSEAELLRPYIEGELLKAIRTYEKKYGLKLPGKVQVEVYPNHEDFAVRTMGMPGLGALGVTFGRYIAMDSPSGRPPGEFHWASTLWHEMSHVYCLTATNHRVPRWFTEGLAVHEETAVSPEWGDRVSAPIIAALKEDKLLSVGELDRGFIRPTYPAQVVVSYFEAGRICDYINERWGYSKLMDMMHAFGRKEETPRVIPEQLGISIDQFDKDFRAWLDNQLGSIVKNYDEWKAEMKVLTEAASDGRVDEVIEKGPHTRGLNPEYVEEGSAYELLAQAWLAKGNKKEAAAELERYMHAGGRNRETLEQLATLQEGLGQPGEAAATLDRINYIDPVGDEELHRRLGELWLNAKNIDGAIREFRAVIAMHPLDKATSEYNLARAYRAAGRNQDAFEHVVSSLEAAPGYRPAQKMLLELNDAPTSETKRE